MTYYGMKVVNEGEAAQSEAFKGLVVLDVTREDSQNDADLQIVDFQNGSAKVVREVEFMSEFIFSNVKTEADMMRFLQKKISPQVGLCIHEDAVKYLKDLLDEKKSFKQAPQH